MLNAVSSDAVGPLKGGDAAAAPRRCFSRRTIILVAALFAVVVGVGLGVGLALGLRSRSSDSSAVDFALECEQGLCTSNAAGAKAIFVGMDEAAAASALAAARGSFSRALLQDSTNDTVESGSKFMVVLASGKTETLKIRGHSGTQLDVSSWPAVNAMALGAGKLALVFSNGSYNCLADTTTGSIMTLTRYRYLMNFNRLFADGNGNIYSLYPSMLKQSPYIPNDEVRSVLGRVLKVSVSQAGNNGAQAIAHTLFTPETEYVDSIDSITKNGAVFYTWFSPALVDNWNWSAGGNPYSLSSWGNAQTAVRLPAAPGTTVNLNDRIKAWITAIQPAAFAADSSNLQALTSLGCRPGTNSVFYALRFKKASTGYTSAIDDNYEFGNLAIIKVTVDDNGSDIALSLVGAIHRDAVSPAAGSSPITYVPVLSTTVISSSVSSSTFSANGNMLFLVFYFGGGNPTTGVFVKSVTAWKLDLTAADATSLVPSVGSSALADGVVSLEWRSGVHDLAAYSNSWSFGTRVMTSVMQPGISDILIFEVAPNPTYFANPSATAGTYPSTCISNIHIANLASGAFRRDVVKFQASDLAAGCVSGRVGLSLDSSAIFYGVIKSNNDPKSFYRFDIASRTTQGPQSKRFVDDVPIFANVQ